MSAIKITAATIIVPLAFLAGCSSDQPSTEPPSTESVVEYKQDLLQHLWSQASREDQDWFCETFQADPAGTTLGYHDQINSEDFDVYVSIEEVAEFCIETCGAP